MYRPHSRLGGPPLITEQMKIRVLRVVGDICNNAADPRDVRWLEDLLCADPEVCALYLDYMSLHACLHAEGASHVTEMENACEELGESLLSLTSQIESQKKTSTFSSKTKSQWNSWALAIALAGVALFSSAITLVAFRSGNFFADATTTDTDQQVVATVTGTHNCMWGKSKKGVGYGSELVAGQNLELIQGVAEITFDDGATVLIESPANFVVQAPHQCQLHSGRISAIVPSQSRGFRVRTRSLDVFDVGNEYGLLAKQSGASEVHVFNGLVKADVLDESGRRTRRLELNASEAARVNSVSTTVLEFPANETMFVRNMMPSSGPHDGLLAYESFDYPEGPMAAQNGGFGWAGPWFDIAADSEQGPSSNRVSTGSLTFEGISPQGNRAVQASQQNRIRRSLGTAVGGVFDVAGLVENQDGLRLVGRDGQEVYISFIQRVSALSNDVDHFYGVELHRGDGNANRVLCVGHGAEETGYGVTSNTNVYGVKNFPTLGKQDTEPNLIVIKITYGATNQDMVEVYRNPESLRDEKLCSPDAVLKGNFAFDRISIANFHGEKIHEVDELRIGTHYLAVTGRWGGDRGHLLRRITNSEPNVQHQQSLLGQMLLSNSRKLPLLALSR